MAARRPKLSRPHTPATPAELDAAAVITPLDIAHAAAAWEQDAPPAFRQLLNATEYVPEPPPRRKPSIDSGPG